MEDLNDVLNGPMEPAEAAAPDVLETPEPQIDAAPAQPRDESGRFAPKGETEQPAQAPVAAPPAAEDDPKGLIPRQALIEERRKRQELEQQLRDFRQPQHHAQPEAPPRQPVAAPVPVVFDDEYAQSIFEMAVAHVRQELVPQIQTTAAQTTFEMQRTLMGTSHADFAETEASFIEMARSNPALIAEANRQPNPAKWAYDYAKKAQEVAQIGSLDLEAIKKAAVAEYIAQNAPAPAAAPQPIPTSLADAQSARTTVPAQGPPTLNDILGRR